MNIRATAFFSKLLVDFWLHQVSCAQEINQTFSTTEGFSIRLPADWKRIDNQTLADASKSLAQDVPNAKFQNLPSDGFEPKAIEQGIGCPGIIVIPNKIPGMNGRISEQDFKQYAAFLRRRCSKARTPLSTGTHLTHR